ncbi:magnesium transporter [Nitzschia inconspicua]|uniref:Magnesium transporter n=1 Tax=Nitzschia inconspicua TaxID=303405 RepID=A0A9K3KU81_9STRA|nr:magnesium transporter [Nitzschia inconspicua]
MDNHHHSIANSVDRRHDSVEEDESWSRHVEADDVEEEDEEEAAETHVGPSLLMDTAVQEDDEDEDNWSRQVETDDIQRMPSSVTGDINTLDGDDEMDDDVNGVVVAALPPRRDEPTLKEQLVERERQRRVESERARWKRQFAMAAHTEADDEEDQYETSGGIYGDNGMSENGMDSNMANRETNSVAGTVGEDTVAPIETLEDETSKMNYPMERFLQEQENSLQQEADTAKKEPPRDTLSNQGVVMERFLQEPTMVVVDGPESATSHVMDTPSNVQRSVSFDTDHSQTIAGMPVPVVQRDYLNMSTASSIADTSQEGPLPLHAESLALGSVYNASTTCLPPSEDDQDELPLEIPAIQRPEQVDETHLGDNLHREVAVPGDLHQDGSESPSEPRMLRLTEAEIQEMEAIDEASRSNAPPSERDDMSELGELVSDFGGPIHMDHPNNSQGTPTTAMESASSVANQSGRVHTTNDDQLSIDASSQVVPSSVGGDASIAANPPSEVGLDEDEPRDILVSSEMLPVSPPPIELHEPSQVRPGDTSMPRLGTTPSGPGAQTENELLDQYASYGTIVNRTMRPGLFNYNQNLRGDIRNMSDTPSARLKKASSLPDHGISGTDGGGTAHIEGFDFDKNDLEFPESPSKPSDTDMLLQNEMWSPGLSPSNKKRPPDQGNSEGVPMPFLHHYDTPAAEEVGQTRKFSWGHKGRLSEIFSRKWSDANNDERKGLLEGVPGEVTTSPRNSNFASFTSIRTVDDLNSLAESVFSDLRSEGSSTVRSISNEAKEYLECSIWQRAFPERLFALTVTLLFEIPVLLMVSGGSDRLCYLIGRTKYQLLIGFLPLSSAISGNVGLQASTLTTRAISHGQVKVENYKNWLFKEIGAAAYLGIGMGVFLGTIAFFASGYSVPFGLTVMIAQFISILTAGCTGTFAPLLFTFIFERDSGKWGGPLETAVQDIVGSFAMVIISYQILLWMGPYEVAENDMCGAGDL